ncbi:MAG: hypothetical protein V3U87_12815 [Methylococcaceae bacterium]
MKQKQADKFREISEMAFLKYQEWRIYEDKRIIAIESELMERFPSLDYFDFMEKIMGGCKSNDKGEFLWLGKVIFKDKSQLARLVDTTWGVEPDEEQIKSYQNFLYAIFKHGLVIAITNEETELDNLPEVEAPKPHIEAI